jgi:hypothetical protein
MADSVDNVIAAMHAHQIRRIVIVSAASSLPHRIRYR